MAWQTTTEIQPENNELIKCRTSGLQNKIRPFANCSNETKCQNRGNFETISHRVSKPVR